MTTTSINVNFTEITEFKDSAILKNYNNEELTEVINAVPNRFKNIKLKITVRPKIEDENDLKNVIEALRYFGGDIPDEIFEYLKESKNDDHDVLDNFDDFHGKDLKIYKDWCNKQCTNIVDKVISMCSTLLIDYLVRNKIITIYTIKQAVAKYINTWSDIHNFYYLKYIHTKYFPNDSLAFLFINGLSTKNENLINYILNNSNAKEITHYLKLNQITPYVIIVSRALSLSIYDKLTKMCDLIPNTIDDDRATLKYIVAFDKVEYFDYFMKKGKKTLLSSKLLIIACEHNSNKCLEYMDNCGTLDALIASNPHNYLKRARIYGNKLMIEKIKSFVNNYFLIFQIWNNEILINTIINDEIDLLTFGINNGAPISLDIVRKIAINSSSNNVLSFLDDIEKPQHEIDNGQSDVT